MANDLWDQDTMRSMLLSRMRQPDKFKGETLAELVDHINASGDHPQFDDVPDDINEHLRRGEAAANDKAVFDRAVEDGSLLQKVSAQTKPAQGNVWVPFALLMGLLGQRIINGPNKDTPGGFDPRIGEANERAKQSGPEFNEGFGLTPEQTKTRGWWNSDEPLDQSQIETGRGPWSGQPTAFDHERTGEPPSQSRKVIDTAASMLEKNEFANKDELVRKFKLKTDQQGNPEAWCAAFINWALRANGLPDTGSARSRSFATYGSGVPSLTDAKPGDIAILYSGGDLDFFHTVMILSVNADRGTAWVIEGNAGGVVKIEEMPINTKAGDMIRRPPYKGEPQLPVGDDVRPITMDDFGNPFDKKQTWYPRGSGGAPLAPIERDGMRIIEEIMRPLRRRQQSPLIMRQPQLEQLRQRLRALGYGDDEIYDFIGKR